MIISKTFVIGKFKSMGGGIDYGIYFNFDTNRKILEISNEPSCDECTPFEDIIEAINRIK